MRTEKNTEVPQMEEDNSKRGFTSLSSHLSQPSTVHARLPRNIAEKDEANKDVQSD